MNDASSTCHFRDGRPYASHHCCAVDPDEIEFWGAEPAFIVSEGGGARIFVGATRGGDGGASVVDRVVEIGACGGTKFGRLTGCGAAGGVGGGSKPRCFAIPAAGYSDIAARHVSDTADWLLCRHCA